MIFDLVTRDRRFDLVDRHAQKRNRKIAHADGADAAFVHERHHGVENFGKVHPWCWPVHEIQIDMFEFEFCETGLERGIDPVTGQMIVPDLGRDVEVRAADAGCGNGLADRRFVAIHLRRIDVAIAKRQRAFNCSAADIALHLEGAKPEFRQANALGRDGVHDLS